MQADQHADNESGADLPREVARDNLSSSAYARGVEALIGAWQPAKERDLPSVLDGIQQDRLISRPPRVSSADLWTRLSALFARGAELSSLLDHAAELLGRSLGDACAVILPHGERGRFVSASSWAVNPDLGTHLVGLLADVCLGQADVTAMEMLASGRSLFVPHIAATTSPEPVSSVSAYSFFRSLVVAPMRTDQGLLGALCLATARDGSELSEQDRDLVVSVAEQLAVAVEESRRRLATDEQHQRLKALVDAMPVGAMMADISPRKPLLVNKAGRMLLGCPEDSDLTLGEVRSRTSVERPDGSICAPAELPIARSLQYGELCLTEELVVVHPDGKRVPVLSSSAPLRDADGQIVAAVTVFQDVTRLKQADRLKRDLLSRVVHELKTPVTAIKGAAAVALNSPRSLHRDEIGELLRIVDEQADRLRWLCDDIHDVSRIQDGLLRMQIAPTVLRQVLQAAAERFRLGGWRHEIDMDVTDNLPLVLADPQRLCEALNHLLQSVARLAPPTGLIHVSARICEGETAVQVAFGERGVPAPRLGEVPGSLDSTDDPEINVSDKSAVGLAIAKGIAKAHGGRLLTELNDSGEACRFTLTLPIAQEAQLPSVPPKQRPRARGKDQRQRVLVVDDAARTAELMRRSLENAGYRAVVTGGAESVLGMVELEQPDLVLLDLMLPDMSGFEVLRQLREFSGLPVIIVSVKEDEEDKVRALELGADDYITKPFGLSEFLARVRAVLRRSTAASETPPKLPFVLDDLVVDFSRRKVMLAEHEVHLSPTEYKLLHELVVHTGQILTHDQLLERVWGKEYAGAHDLVRSFVRSLRKKLGDGAGAPHYIATEQGVGYYIRTRDS